MEQHNPLVSKQKQLEECVQTIADLVARLDEARALEKRLTEEINQEKLSKVVSQTLPMDILYLIYEECVRDDPNSKYKLLSVCRNWRHAAQLHHTLWTQIYIKFDYEIERMKRCTGLLYMHLGNSGSASLDIILDYTQFYPGNDSTRYHLNNLLKTWNEDVGDTIGSIGKVELIYDSWRNYVETVEMKFPFEKAFEHIYRVPFRLLRNSYERWHTFELRDPNGYLGPGDGLLTENFFPILKSLLLVYPKDQDEFEEGESDALLPALEELHLSKSTNKLREIVRIAPMLQRLALHSYCADTIIKSVLTLHHLRRLHITIPDDDKSSSFVAPTRSALFPCLSYICVGPKTPNGLIAAIDAPALETLVMASGFFSLPNLLHTPRLILLNRYSFGHLPSAAAISRFSLAKTLGIRSSETSYFRKMILRERKMTPFMPLLDTLEVLGDFSPTKSPGYWQEPFLKDLFDGKDIIADRIPV